MIMKVSHLGGLSVCRWQCLPCTQEACERRWPSPLWALRRPQCPGLQWQTWRKWKSNISWYHQVYQVSLSDCWPSAGFLILEGDRIAHHWIEGVLVGDVRQLWPGGKNTSYCKCKWWTNAHIYLGSWLIFGSLRSIIMHLIQIERWPKMMEGSTYFGCSSSSFSFLRLAGAFLKKFSAWTKV